MSLVITRTRITKYEITDVELNILRFNDQYRRIRGNRKYRGFSCFVCRSHFEDGDPIGIVMTIKGNKTVCKDCGEGIKKELEAVVDA